MSENDVWVSATFQITIAERMDELRLIDGDAETLRADLQRLIDDGQGTDDGEPNIVIRSLERMP